MVKKLFGDRFQWIVCLILSAVFMAAALPKLWDPDGFARAVDAYELLPRLWTPAVARMLAWFELIAGAALLIPRFRVVAAYLLGACCTVFLFAICSVLFRGLTIDCGCFSWGSRQVGWLTFVADVVLLLMCVFGTLARSGLKADTSQINATSGEKAQV